MRKLIVSTLISLDGFCAGEDGNPGVLPMDMAFDTYNLERMRSADHLLFGATTFNMFRSFWPRVQDNEEAPETLREISRLNNALPKIVVSDSLPPIIAGDWNDTEVVRRAAVKDRIAALKQDEGRDILVFGSHVLWNHLLAVGLVDEIYVLVGSLLLGTGVPAFEKSSQAGLQRLDTRIIEGSDTVLLRYGVTAAAA